MQFCKDATINVLAASRCTHEEALVLEDSLQLAGAFSYGGKTPPQQHSASAPAEYKLWEPVEARGNGSLFQWVLISPSFSGTVDLSECQVPLRTATGGI